MLEWSRAERSVVFISPEVAGDRIRAKRDKVWNPTLVKVIKGQIQRL